MAFYKQTEEGVLKADTMVATPNYTLKAEDRNEYTLPIDGWYWFSTDEDASLHFGVPVGDSFPPDVEGVPAESLPTIDVAPPPVVKLSNGMVLAAAKSDRDAFTQMTVLIDLALRSGAMPPQAPQTFKDAYGALQTVAAVDFLKLMLEYGVKAKDLWERGEA
jgi:hypothetical protein